MKRKSLLILSLALVAAGCQSYPKDPPPCASTDAGPCGPEIPVNTTARVRS